MKDLGYYNGNYGLLEEMKIPMLDRVCFFGDGVYDATYSHNHVIHDLDLHMNRFYNSAKLLEIEIPHTKAELKSILQEMVEKVDAGDQFVYWQTTRGTGFREHAYPDPKEVPANIWIMLRETSVQDTYKKINLITREDTRFYHCNIKTLNLLPSCMAANATALAGADECVMHRGDEVTECAHSNVHIIKDGVFRTHPTDCLILPGIARMNLIRKCKELGIPVEEKAFTVEEMMNADEIIVSSVGSFCLAAKTVDGQPVGGGAADILKRLQDALMKEFIAECGE